MSVTCQTVVVSKSQVTLNRVRVSVVEKSGALEDKFVLVPLRTSVRQDLPVSVVAPIPCIGHFVSTIKLALNVAIPPHVKKY